MGFEITERALAASLQTDVRPQLVLEIEGYPTVFGTSTIKKVIRYGDADLEYGEGDLYGGFRAIDDQLSVISFQNGTTSQIKQQLQLFKGQGDSISSMRIALVDLNTTVTRDLLTPDETQTPTFDLLGQRCKIWYGFEDTEFKKDYIVLFRGVIQSVDSKPGLILLNINHPDDRKRSTLFVPGETQLDGAISAGQTTIDVDDTTGFLAPVTGPDGTIDETIKYYVLIESVFGTEVIRYEGLTATQLQSCTRGQLGTTAATHPNDTRINSFYTIEGTAIDIALKLMLSGTNGPMFEDVAVSRFVSVGGVDTVPNSMFFENVNLEQEYGLVVGDFVSTSGATNGSNNVTLQPIVGIDSNDLGSYLIIGGTASFIEESDTSAVVDFRSQYDTLGEGAAMRGDEVDILQHQFIDRTFLSSYDYLFYLRDEINLKEFLSQKVYNPAAAYSVPRQAKASVGFHLAGQLPGTSTKTLNASNVKSPSKISIKRSTSDNFYNGVVYKYEVDLVEDRYLAIESTIDVDSTARIDVGPKALVIEADGLRELLSGKNLAQQATSRRLKKFKFGAETLPNVATNLKAGFDLELGDTVVIDLAQLQISDIDSGTRRGASRIFEIINKTFDLRKGATSFKLVDANFQRDTRYALVSPSSFIKTASSDTQFTIEESFNSRYGVNEFRKWENFVSNILRDGTGLNVRATDNSVLDATTLASLSGNTITVDPALSGTPPAGYIMESDGYNEAIEEFQLLYGYMSDTAFADGKPQYVML